MRTIYQGGRFFTAKAGTSPENPFESCMIVQGDVIDYVGNENDAQVQKAKAEGVSLVDMKGQVVVPGFIDGHMHLLLLASALKRVNLEDCKNLDDIRSTIKSYAVANPSAPRILCRGWMHPMTDGVALASMLDDLDDRPIFIDSKDLHSTWCNTPALKELDIDSTPGPAGGEIFRDGAGKPSGLMSESAAQIYVWPHIAKVTPMADKIDAMKQAINAYTATGYTGMIEMATDDNIWEALQLLKSQETLPFRLAAYWLIKPSDSEGDCLAQVDHAIAIHKRFNAETSPDCRVTGIKIICDGVVDACTATLSEPYSSNGASPDPLWDPKILEAFYHSF
jgi:predicted amidohydrolase YtcJ